MRTIVSALVTVTILLGFTDMWAAQQVPQLPGRVQTPVRPMPTPVPTAEDCVGFNPATATVVQSGNSWRIVDGNHSMFDFGPNKNHADYSLSVIKTYGMNQSCFIGRPQPSLQYMLVSGRAPSGSIANEDCLSFNPAAINVANIQNDWKIVEGNHWMFSFGNKEAEARQAFAQIKRHNFNSNCYVGRPNARFTYLKAAGPPIAQAPPQLAQRPVGPALPNVHPPAAAQVPGLSPAVPGATTPPTAPAIPPQVRPAAPGLPPGAGPQLERPPLLRPVGGPDLKVDRVWLAQYVPPAQLQQYTPLSGNPSPGQQVYLVCEFENAGADLKGEWNVAYLVDGQQVYGQRFGDLPAKTKRNPAAPYVVQGAGTHRYECVLDPENRIAEAGADGNNRGSVNFQVAGGGTPPAGPGIPTHVGPPRPGQQVPGGLTPPQLPGGVVPPQLGGLPSTPPSIPTHVGPPQPAGPGATPPGPGQVVPPQIARPPMPNVGQTGVASPLAPAGVPGQRPPLGTTPPFHGAILKADLRVTKVWLAQYVPPAQLQQYTALSGQPDPGQQVYLVCEFENAGADLRGEWNVAYLVDGQQVYGQRFGDIPAGSKRNPAASYTVTRPGPHRYECVLDPENRLGESSEANNRQSVEFQVKSSITVTTPGPSVIPHPSLGDTLRPTGSTSGQGLSTSPGLPTPGHGLPTPGQQLTPPSLPKPGQGLPTPPGFPTPGQGLPTPGQMPTPQGFPQPSAPPALGSLPHPTTPPNYGTPVTGPPPPTAPNYGTPATTGPSPTSSTSGVHHADPAPPPRPDLRVQKAWVALMNADRTQYVPLPNPMPGQEVLLVCEFDNAGAPTSGQVRVGWYIDGQMIGDMGVNNMATGQKRNPARPYTFSSPGIHRYECVLDAEGRANESAEGNNRQLISVQVGAGGPPSAQPGQPSSPVGPGGLANLGQPPTPPGPPGLGTPPNQLICPAGYNRVPIPAPPFVDCISDPWKEVDQVSPSCPPVPWPAQGSYVNDKSGHEDKCVAKGPLPPEIEGPTLCPPPVPGGKVEKKVQPGKDVCRIFVPNPPQRTSPIVQQ